MTRWPTGAVVAVLLNVVAANTPAGQQPQAQLTISITTPTPRLEAGTPLYLRVQFTNISRGPLLLERPVDLGERGLNVVASRGECRFRVSTVHFDTQVAWRGATVLPLLPGDAVSMDVPPLNDPSGWGGPVLPFPSAGVYRVYAELISEGESRHGPHGPMWRGVTRSPEIVLEVTDPPRATVSAWRDRLRGCVTGGCDDFAPFEYFRFVRDEQAAELLAAALPNFRLNPWIVSAIEHQRRTGDAALLEAAVAASGESAGDWGSTLLAAARRIRERGSCSAGSDK